MARRLQQLGEPTNNAGDKWLDLLQEPPIIGTIVGTFIVVPKLGEL